MLWADWDHRGGQMLARNSRWDLAAQGRLKADSGRLVLQHNDSFRRNLPFVILQGDRPLHLQQWPLKSDWPDEKPSDSYDLLFAAHRSHLLPEANRQEAAARPEPGHR